MAMTTQPCNQHAHCPDHGNKGLFLSMIDLQFAPVFPDRLIKSVKTTSTQNESTNVLILLLGMGSYVYV